MIVHLILLAGMSAQMGVGGPSAGNCTTNCGGLYANVASGDTRTITEPTFPPVCSQVAATKFLVSTNAVNVDPYNATCGSTGGTLGTLGCTGGTSYEPSSSSSSYVAAETLDNTAFQAALNACPSGQAVEVVPGASGQRALVLAPWNLPSGVSIIVDAGVTVKASRNLTDYGGTNCGIVSARSGWDDLESAAYLLGGIIPSYGVGKSTKSSSCNHWITSPGSSGSGIYGYGVLDGRGWAAYTGGGGSFYGNRIQAYCNARGGPAHGSPNCTPTTGNTSYGPNAIDLVTANNFTMYKITVKDSGNFLVNWKGGNGFLGWGVKLIAPFEVANTDGWDPEGSSNGTFTHGYISNGDNQVAVKSTSQAASNISFTQNQTSAGIAIALGSATQFGTSNILISDNVQNGNLYNDQSAGLQIASSGANGGLVNQVTFANDCMKNEQNSVRIYTNYGGGSGSFTPIYQNILLRNINVLPSTAPYTTGNSGYYTFQGLLGNPILGQIDNLQIQGVNQGVASQNGVTTDQYGNYFNGPAQAIPSSVMTQFAAGTGMSTYGMGGSGTAFPCTNASWAPLIGELNIKTPAANNNQTYNNTGGTGYTLQATLEPATEISTKESSAPTAAVTFLDNGVSIGSQPLIGSGDYAFINVAAPPPPGTHTYTVQYPGDSNYAAYSFGSVSVTNPALPSLPTDANDYTCGGGQPCPTWTMPAQPAAGSSYTDSNYGTTSYRLVPPSNSSSGNVIPTYSRVQSWNSDGTRLMMLDGNTADLYDATTTPPAPMGRIILNGEIYAFLDPGDNDVAWANTDPNTIFFTSFSSSHGLDLRKVNISSCVVGSCNVTPVLLHTFACTTDANSPLGAGIAGNKIETGSGAQGGMIDATDTYASFSCDFINGNGRNEIDLISYNMKTDTILVQEKWYNLCPGSTPSGCKVTHSLPLGANLFRMSQHPDGAHNTIIWQTNTSDCPAIDSSWVRSCATESFDHSFNYLGGINAYNGHQDMGYDINGLPVWVGSCNTNAPKQYRCFQITNLNTLSPTAITGTRILLPCSFSYTTGCESGTNLVGSKSWHVSMTSWQHWPGWALVSTMMLAGPNSGHQPLAPGATTLGTAVAAAGTVTITPGSMATIAPGVLSVIDYGQTNAEVLTWTATTSTTATATFAKTHAATATIWCMSCGNTGFGAMEILEMKIDSTVANLSNAVYYRVARSHAIQDGNYSCEPHATVSRDFSSFITASSWDKDCNPGTGATIVNGYWMPVTPPH